MGMQVIPPTPGTNQFGAVVVPASVVPVPATPVSATAAANTAVVITINGAAGQQIRLESLVLSYSAAPTGGTITVVANAVTVFQADITAAGMQAAPLPEGGLTMGVNQTVTITLTAAGAAVVGRVSVGYVQR